MTNQVTTAPGNIRLSATHPDADIHLAFAAGFEQLRRDGYLTEDENEVALTRKGLLQVDRLLPTFFEPQHRGARYT